MERKYKNPPILEAICEFRLTPDTPWDLAIPGLFYERVKDNFPHREQRMVQEIVVRGIPQSFQHRVQTTERVLFFVPDRRTLVQIGPRLLVINTTKPYPTWEGFKPYIKKAWESLQQVVEVRGLEQMGLHYINQIELPSQEANLEEYFEFYPFVGKRLPQRMVGFISGAEFAYAENRDHCRVQLVPAISESSQMVLILEIHYFLARPRAVSTNEVFDWLEEAHGRLIEIFEGCITDRLRQIFDVTF